MHVSGGLHMQEEKKNDNQKERNPIQKG
jgi:hypothetical protein